MIADEAIAGSGRVQAFDEFTGNGERGFMHPRQRP